MLLLISHAHFIPGHTVINMEEESHHFGLITRRRVFFSRETCGADCFTPHPSPALVKFWQGRTELSLRLLSLILAVGTLVASLFFLSALTFPETDNDEIETARDEIKKVVVWVICTGVVSVIVESMIVLGRFVNFECATLHSTLVLISDVIASVVFTAAYFTLAVPLAVYSSDLSRLQGGGGVPNQDTSVHYHPLQTRCYITIGLCSGAMLLFLLLAVWMATYLSFNWDRRQRQHLRRSETLI